jgi:hypothetical protein
MSVLNLRKVIALPGSPVPNTIYLVKGAGDTEVTPYITDATGIAIPFRNSIGNFAPANHSHASGAAFHDQPTASTTWTFTHGLGIRNPGVTVWDINNKVLVPSNIEGISNTVAVITFSSAVAGKAIALGGAVGGQYSNLDARKTSIINSLIFG